MKITFLCSDASHPVYKYLLEWAELNKAKNQIKIVHSKKDLQGGDLLIMISCSEIITSRERSLYAKSLVLHASDLPRGRGWSPHIWEIMNGAQKLTVSLIEAEDLVDSGSIWHQIQIEIPKDALWDEINHRLFEAELLLIDFAVRDFSTIAPKKQNSDIPPTYYKRRGPNDSEINPELSISSQFNKIRVCDPKRFPAYFFLHGSKYIISLKKSE